MKIFADILFILLIGRLSSFGHEDAGAESKNKKAGLEIL